MAAGRALLIPDSVAQFMDRVGRPIIVVSIPMVNVAGRAGLCTSLASLPRWALENAHLQNGRRSVSHEFSARQARRDDGADASTALRVAHCTATSNLQWCFRD